MTVPGIVAGCHRELLLVCFGRRVLCFPALDLSLFLVLFGSGYPAVQYNTATLTTRFPLWRLSLETGGSVLLTSEPDILSC